MFNFLIASYYVQSLVSEAKKDSGLISGGPWNNNWGFATFN